MSTKILYGVCWYYYLVGRDDGKKTLFDAFPREQCVNKLVVCLDWKELEKEYRLYTVFKNYLEFNKYLNVIPVEKRAFYEIILGENPQKPHFDIDIQDSSIDGNQFVNKILDILINIFEKEGIVLDTSKHLAIYTSHGNGKQSFHIVIDGYCHLNNIEARGLYEQVALFLTDKEKEWLDSSVYSPTQQFRILGCSKLHKNRPKIFNVKNWKYVENPIDIYHKNILDLSISLVTVTNDCQILLPTCAKPTISSVVSNFVQTVTPDDANKALHLLAKYAKCQVYDLPYKIGGVKSPFILLKRIKPSPCRICERMHYAENPYLIVNEFWDVYFCCRRDFAGKHFKIGSLAVYQTIERIKKELENIPLNNAEALNVVEECHFENLKPLTAVNLATFDSIPKKLPTSREERKLLRQALGLKRRKKK